MVRAFCGLSQRWHGIPSAGTAGVATQYAPSGKIAARARPMRLQCSDGIGRTARSKTALAPEPGTQQQLVAAQHCHQRLDHCTHHSGPAGLGGTPASSKSEPSSARNTFCRPSERALTKRVRSSPPRSLNSQSPHAKRSQAWSKAARPCRLTRLRVTARRASRFGTINPSRRVSSTASDCMQSSPVDKSSGKDMRPGTTWCRAKCSLRAQGRTPRARLKSTSRIGVCIRCCVGSGLRSWVRSCARSWVRSCVRPCIGEP